LGLFPPQEGEKTHNAKRISSLGSFSSPDLTRGRRSPMSGLPPSGLMRARRGRVKPVPDFGYSDADIEAAIASLTEPGRLRTAQELLARAAPRLHRILDDSLSEGGWFDPAHAQAVREAAGTEDPGARVTAVRTLIAEETRLGMFVGVAVGFELARELGYADADAAPADSTSSGSHASPGAAPDVASQGVGGPDPRTPQEGASPDPSTPKEE
jgi:hypothetical protein